MMCKDTNLISKCQSFSFIFLVCNLILFSFFTKISYLCSSL
ncbi:hypothetical protein HMPREF1551_02351 [Capnocytophaga sp. oral taxon 863 str. F0517]|nr:hypothetical protein HMPREF1551_02351 [Capnocytophaga sp. oral taxon 863 str. F0517]